MGPEERVHFSVCDYLKLQYPHVHFYSDSSGIRVSRGLQQKLKRTRSNHTLLDLVILEPIVPYHGLILELKAKSVYKKGTRELLKNDHHFEQVKTIERFRQKGYASCFACSFDEAKEIIDSYLNGRYIQNSLPN